ncbi:cupin domain-containing protein [Halarsenatibacter silvermanii]|uniref:Cupin domain-containing protein n=1 Tax=Halarsenatibacter silvermanii TaxID=321763 RepID=A0A1G9T7Y6_9FIRM|nr:cupin domain-containing protein [Halarsenatibacter silvermanii]SDM43758.1 Cupin domain-containing protein [Halarsenatibacter silvermanii]
MQDSTVHNIQETIEYQKNSIVSKTVIDKDTGTVTLFAFDEGQNLSEHSAPHEAMVHVIDGVGEYTIGGKTHRVEAGEMIVMPADIPHSVRAPEKFKMVLIMIENIEE